MGQSIWSLMILPLLAVSAGLSQAAEAPREDVPYRFTASVDAVHLNVSVVNKKGRLVTDLSREDFMVIEDNVHQKIVYFARGEDAPLDVVLLVDASGSMELTEKATNARNAAIQLIHSLGPEDRVSVYAFDRDVYQLTEFTQNKTEAIEALNRLEPFGSTALYDAVVTLSSVAVHEGFGRRAIVVTTDGVDTSSDHSVEEAVSKAKGVDLPVYTIRVISPVDDPENDLFLGVHGAHFQGEDALRRFTAETGGQMFQGSEWGQLVKATARIREEMKTQYRIGYVPVNPRNDDGFRQITVSTPRRRGVEVRTRKGYYPARPGSSPNEPEPTSVRKPGSSY
ncbi:MAG TPA: VWA domain-containing protein [Vicinamibacteria bacterium]